MVVSGSHGGTSAAEFAARAGVRAVIFNDAGVGKENAGVRGLELLDALGIAAATVASALLVSAMARTRWHAALSLS